MKMRTSELYREGIEVSCDSNSLNLSRCPLVELFPPLSPTAAAVTNGVHPCLTEISDMWRFEELPSENRFIAVPKDDCFCGTKSGFILFD